MVGLWSSYLVFILIDLCVNSHDWSICSVVNLDCGWEECTMQLSSIVFAFSFSLIEMLLYLDGFAYCICRMKRPLLPPHQRLEYNVCRPNLMRYLDHFVWIFCFFR